MDYYPFGMIMPGRKYSATNAYRYGFNGKENDNEVKGEGNQQDYGMRIYDPRLGKFLSVDPLTQEYAMLTPYQFASNTPIMAIDLDGEEAKPRYILSNPAAPQLDNTAVFETGHKKMGIYKNPKPKPKPIEFPEVLSYEEMRSIRTKNGKTTARLLLALFTPAKAKIFTVLGPTGRVFAAFLLNRTIEAAIDVFGQLANNNFEINKVDWIDVATNYLPGLKGKWGEVLTAVYKNVIEASADYTTDSKEGGFKTIFGDKNLTNAGIEAFAGAIFDGIYGPLNEQLKKKLKEQGFDDKKIDKIMLGIISKQSDIAKEMSKNGIQDALKLPEKKKDECE